MLNSDGSDYNKTLSYYFIGHFSKFIKPGAVRVAYSKYISDIYVTAFKNPDGKLIVVVYNGSWNDTEFNMCIKKKRIKDCIEKDSIITYEIELF